MSADYKKRRWSLFETTYDFIELWKNSHQIITIPKNKNLYNKIFEKKIKQNDKKGQILYDRNKWYWNINIYTFEQ